MFYIFHLAFCKHFQLTNGYLAFSDNNGVHDVDSTVTYYCDQGYDYLTTNRKQKDAEKTENG